MNIAKTKTAILLVLSLTACASTYAAQTASVEVRKSFIKITEGEKRVGAPVDFDAPDVLYVRKADIIRVSVFFAARNSEYRVMLVTYGPGFNSRVEEEKIAAVNSAKTYAYAFPSEASALSFAESLVAD